MESNSEDEDKIITKARMHNRIVTKIIVFTFCLIITFCVLLVSIKYIITKNPYQIIDHTTKVEYLSYKNGIETNEYRLPKNLIPYYYDLKIFTNFDSFTKPSNFNGSVEISFKCLADTNRIVLNAYDLVIRNDSIMVVDIDNGDRYIYSKPINDRYKQILIIPLLKSLKLGHNYSIYIEYEGFLIEDNAGLYLASYLDLNNQRR